MFKNYVKTAWRTITKNRVYSLINILGLTIGLSACMIVATVVIDDLSYDRQWSKGNDIYRIISGNKMGDGIYDRFAGAFAGLNGVLKNNYPEAEAMAKMVNHKGRLKIDDKNPNGVETTILSADTSFWKMLDINVVAGNPKKYVAGIGNIIISKSFRNKFFPNENPVGKTIYDVPTYTEKPTPYLITGIIKDLPSNSVLRADVIKVDKPLVQELSKKQYGTNVQTYILMKPGTDIKKFESKLNKWYADFVEVKNPFQFAFQPMKDIYLHSDFAQGQEVQGDFKNIYILSGVALLLLIIACINFINLTTARAVKRLRETGVRKILGAGRLQLIFQFLTESILFFAIATVLATLLYQVSLSSVENSIGHKLSQTFVSKFYLLIISYGVILMISFFTGLYPAWILSGVKPAATLKDKLFTGNFSGQNFIRKSLVSLQFSLSIIVLVALIIVQQQVSFMKNKPIGFDKNNLLSIGFISWDGKGQSFKNELLRQPGVLQASITSWTPGEGAGNMSRMIDNPEHPDEKIKVWYVNGDADFAKTLGLKLQAGRFLDRSLYTDVVAPDSAQKNWENRSAVLTSYTEKFLNVKKLNEGLENVKITPVGVVADFNTESLKNPMQPTIITAEDSLNYGGMFVRVQPRSEKKVVASINKLWRQFYPDKLLDINWVDDMLANQYKAESKLQQLFTFFSALSMFLAALGIFGLIVQATVQRVREIGIRKVLGASVNSIVRLFSIDFLKLILIAIVIASPVAWWLMNKWLLDFAYRIHINVWVFAIAGFVAIFIALITISFQAIKAAIANPVKSLRTE